MLSQNEARKRFELVTKIAKLKVSKIRSVVSLHGDVTQDGRVLVDLSFPAQGLLYLRELGSKKSLQSSIRHGPCEDREPCGDPFWPKD